MTSFAVWVLVSLTWSPAFSKSPEQKDQNFTFIHVGAEIHRLSNIRVYTDNFQIFFPIPPLPMISKSKEVNCSSTSESFCKSLKENQLFSDVSTELIRLLQKTYRPSGLTAEFAPKFTDNSTVDENYLLELGLSDVNNDWLVQAENSLRVNSVLQKNHSIQTRSILSLAMAKPFLQMGMSQLLPMFLNGDSLLPAMAKIRSFAPKIFKAFTNFPSKISELAVAEIGSMTKTSTTPESTVTDVLKTTINAVRNVFAELGRQSGRSPKVEQKSVTFDVNRMLISLNDEITALGLHFNFVNTEQSKVIRHLILTQIHGTAMEDCSDGKIPLPYVPRAVLIHRLQEIERDLPAHLELVPSSKNVEEYYNIRPASCSFDNNGGVIAIKTYLKPKSSLFHVYDFRPVQFAFESYTCNLNVPAGYFVREEHSETMYPVTSLDEQYCRPARDPICKLPKTSNSDMTEHCLLSLLQGGSIEEIKSSCPLTCRLGSRTTVSPIDDDTVILTHLPAEGTEVTCENGRRHQIRNNNLIGALRFTLGCGCVVEIKGRTIAKSTQKYCESPLPDYKVELLIPLQLSTLTHWAPQIQGSFQEMRLIGTDGIIDHNFKPDPVHKNEASRNYSWQISVPSFILAGVQYLFFIIFLYVYRIGPFHVAAIVIPLVEAKPVYSCDLVGDDEILMWVIFGLIVIGIYPKMVKGLCSNLHSFYQEKLNEAAARQVAIAI